MNHSVSYIIVACTGTSRWFNLDAVRTPCPDGTHTLGRVADTRGDARDDPSKPLVNNPGGAPPLDWVHGTDLCIDAELNRLAGKHQPYEGDPVSTRLLVGDVFERMAQLPDASFDLIVTSPPFLALRSYLPDGHPQKHLEIGSEATPADYLDTLLALTAEWRRLLAPHGSIAIELGDTYAGSGGGGGDYQADGLRAGQPVFDGSGRRVRETRREGYIANGVQPPGRRDLSDGWPLDKSLTGIPTLYAWSLAYGRNLLTGAESPAGQWRIRNLKPWIRSNPPVGALGDKERPATSYITVACVSRDRWFDLDAVRTPLSGNTLERGEGSPRGNGKHMESPTGSHGRHFDEQRSNPGGAPPLDWFHPVDALIDDELGQRAGLRASHQRTAKGVDAVPRNGKSGSPERGNWGTMPEIAQTAGAVGARGMHIRRRLEAAGYLTPQDFYDISPKGYSGMTRPTTRLVPCGPHDGGLRTTSRGCPVHGDRSGPPHTAPDGVHAGSPESRTPRNDGHHAQERPDGSVATDRQSELTTAEPSSDSLPQQCAPAANQRDNRSNRTVLAPLTNPAGTPSAETSDHTARTPTSPSLTEPHPDMPLSSTSAACSDGDTPETTDRSAGMSSAPSDAACTCSYHLAVKDDESTSHYAVWPPELVRLMIDEMCPRKVCRECGEPSRRIVETGPGCGGLHQGTNGGGSTIGGHPNGHRSQMGERQALTLGWSDCGHGNWRPGRILDPFAGSGTTLAVASGMGRDSVGIDLDERNADLCRERVGMFLEVDYPIREVPA